MSIAIVILRCLLPLMYSVQLGISASDWTVVLACFQGYWDAVGAIGDVIDFGKTLASINLCSSRLGPKTGPGIF